MFGTILVFFCILAIIMSLLFVCVCVGGMMGILGLVAPFLLKILSFGFDKRYSEENQPINNECFICLEKISDEVVATCNHSYCGIYHLTKVNALHNIFRQIPTHR